MSKMQISVPINILEKSNYIKKPLFNTAEQKTLECIKIGTRMSNMDLL
ncbi:MAG: hypothetical protein RCG15_03115 [Candidatus Rickettsia vulgarisii]